MTDLAVDYDPFASGQPPPLSGREVPVDHDPFAPSPPKPPFGPIRPGNISNLYDRPRVENPDGSHSTTSSIGVNTDKGEVNIPTVVNGQRLSNFILKQPFQPAVDHYLKTGENLGTYGTPMAADAYAQQLHDEQQRREEASIPRRPRPTFGEHLFANAPEAFQSGTLEGAGVNAIYSAHEQAVIDQLNKWGYTQNAIEAKQKFDAEHAASKQAYEDLPPWYTAPTLSGKITEGSGALLGSVLGGMASPESWATLPGKAAGLVEQGVGALVKNQVAKKVITRGAEQAVVNLATDPVVQGANIATGARDHYDPVQTALAGPLGFLMGATVAAPEAMKGLANVFRTWRGRQGAKVAPEAAPTPEEVSGFEASPEMQSFLQANGITDPKDPRVIQLQDRLTARRTAEAQRGAPQEQGGPTGKFKQDQQRQVMARDMAEQAQPVEETGGATVDNAQHPAALADVGRVEPQRLPEILPVDSQGRADTGDLGVRAGVGAAEQTAASVRQNADEAFRLAAAQRSRAGADVRDTQNPARPEGSNQQNITLDEGFPVQVLGRRMETVKGRQVEMAQVHRYDPRTGALDPEAVPYDVPVNQLKTARYAQVPRMAQDFEARAKGPATPEQPRMSDEAVRREPAQTYRTTAAQPNEDWPGASSARGEVPPEGGPAPGPGPHEGRSPFPDQSQTPPPNKGSFRTRATSEEAVVQEFARRQREEAARKAQEEAARKANGGAASPSSKARPTDNNASTTSKPPGADGRFETDDRGFVTSDKGGPVRFADQKQTAKWIINQGHKLSPDQIFEIENHPSGKGFTVHERGRSEGATSDGAGSSAGQSSTEPPRGAGRAEGQSGPGSQPPHEAADSGASSLRNKFYSNPIADPEVWKELGRILKNSAGWVGDEAKHFATHLKNAMDWIMHGPPDKALAGVQVITDSNDGWLRSTAGRFKSQTVRDIADMFHSPARAVGEKAVGETYHEAVRRNYSTWMNRLADLLEPLAKLEDHEGALAQVGQLIRNPRAIKPGTPIHDAAAGIAKIYKEALDYMRKAGVDVGEIKDGYLTRVENTEKAMLDPAGFKRQAERAYMADGVPAKDARIAADEWFQRLLLGEHGVKSDGTDFVNIGSSTGQPNFTKGRKLSKKADAIMGDFYLSNPADILPRYIMRATKRAEWARRMGPQLEKWKEMKAKMIDEGAGDAVPGVIAAIRSNIGELANATGEGSKFRSYIRTWATLRLMPHSLISSLSEPANAGVRTGNVADSLLAFGTTINQWVPILRKLGKGEELRQMGEDLGYVGDAVDQLITMQRNVGTPETLKGRAIQSQFYKAIGLQQLTDASRIASMKIGNSFVHRLSENILEGRRVMLAKNLLSEMGIPENKHQEFAKWVHDRWETSGSNVGPNVSDILEGGEMGRLHQVAVGRFLDQSIQVPSNATRPRYASHPWGGLLYHLLSFTYAFQKNVLNRALQNAKYGVTKGGLELGERISYAAPLMMLPGLVAINYGINEVRNAFLTDPARYGQQQKTEYQKLIAALSRSNVDGILDYPLNGIFNIGGRYSRDPADAAAGPIWGNMAEALGSFISLFTQANSPNTDTAERKAGREVYDNIIMPTLEAGGLALGAAVGGPVGLGISAGLVQGVSHPAAREALIGATIGPPAPIGGNRAGGGFGGAHGGSHGGAHGREHR